MKYCEKCGVTVNAPRGHCPLCQRSLDAVPGSDPAAEREPFPVIPTFYRRYQLFFRILAFASIVAAVVSVSIDFLLPDPIRWSLFVLAGIGYMWLTVITAVRKWRNICKHILYQIAMLSLAVLIIDRLCGWLKWSVNYVIPLLCVSSMLAITIIAAIRAFREEEFFVYLMVNALFSLIPLLLLITGVLTVRWPSILAVGVSIIILSYFILFSRLNLKSELKRRMHL